MSWNWNVFLKSLLFAFLGFLIGIMSTVIYLAVDVDLSRFDGTLIATIVLAIATVTLVIVSHKYAKSTEEMLEEQKKSREIAFIEKKLEKFYYPTLNFLFNSGIKIVTHNSKPELSVPFNISFIDKRNSNPDYKDIVRHQYLIENNHRYLFEEFNNKVLKSARTQDTEVIDLYEKFKKAIRLDITICKNELNELTMSNN